MPRQAWPRLLTTTLHASDADRRVGPRCVLRRIRHSRDGHGGRRHGRSDVGSRLACEQAIAAVARGQEQRTLDAAFFPEGLNLWRQWLAMELPLDIQRAWLAAVRHLWQAGGGASGTL